MSPFELYWTSYPARFVVHRIARLFPTWFHEKTWGFGKQEAIIRYELIEKAKNRPNAAMLREVILRSHHLLLTLLNERFGGLTLEQHISSPSVRSFSQLYTIIMALLCFRLSTRIEGLREDLVAICRDPDLAEKTWMMFCELGGDENLQAGRIWDESLQVMRGDTISHSSFFRGFFVIVANRAADELRMALP